MVIYAKIRRMFFREHFSISEIQRRTSLSRNTIKKWLKAPDEAVTKYQRAKASGKLTPFEPKLLLALEADSHRPKRDRRTALMLFTAIQKEGFSGGYTIVTDFVRNWRSQTAAVGAKSAYVPLKFELGEAFQFDWSEEWLMVGGIHRKILVAHTKLCASRAFWLTAYPSQSHEMLFDAHARAFTALGGVPKRGIYDNMKTAVDKVSKGNGRIVKHHSLQKEVIAVSVWSTYPQRRSTLQRYSAWSIFNRHRWSVLNRRQHGLLDWPNKPTERSNAMLYLAPSGDGTASFPLIAATDPVGGADHSLPIHPDQGSSKPMEYWEDHLHQRRPRKRPPQAPEQKQPGNEDHQIDDYA